MTLRSLLGLLAVTSAVGVAFGTAFSFIAQPPDDELVKALEQVKDVTKLSKRLGAIKETTNLDELKGLGADVKSLTQAAQSLDANKSKLVTARDDTTKPLTEATTPKLSDVNAALTAAKDLTNESIKKQIETDLLDAYKARLSSSADAIDKAREQLYKKRSLVKVDEESIAGTQGLTTALRAATQALNAGLDTKTKLEEGAWTNSGFTTPTDDDYDLPATAAKKLNEEPSGDESKQTVVERLDAFANSSLTRLNEEFNDFARVLHSDTTEGTEQAIAMRGGLFKTMGDSITALCAAHADFIKAFNTIVDDPQLDFNEDWRALPPLAINLVSLGAFADDVGGMAEYRSEATDMFAVYYHVNIMAIADSLRPGEFKPLNSKSQDVERASSQARSELEGLESNLIELESEILRLDTLKKAEEAALDEDEDELTRLKGQITVKQQEVDAFVKDEKAADELVTAKQNEIDDPKNAEIKERLEAEKTKLSEDKGEITKKKQAAEGDLNKLKTTKTDIEGRISAHSTAIAGFRNQIVEKVGDLRKKRWQRKRVAESEADLFGRVITNEPIYYAPSRVSKDPVRKVTWYAYERSKVFVLRGSREDIEYVKNILAIYDRPAPQARITLHSLQINGSNPGAMAEAIQSINEEIRHARANISLVQAALRNAITREVGRVERTIGQIYPDQFTAGKAEEARSVMSPRAARAYFFNREVRLDLGVVMEPDRETYALSRALVELDEGSIALSQAVASHIAAMQQQSKEATLQRTERELFFTRAGYHSFKLYNYLEAANSNLAAWPETKVLAKFGEGIQTLIRDGDRSDHKFSMKLDAALDDCCNSFPRMKNSLQGLSREQKWTLAMQHCVQKLGDRIRHAFSDQFTEGKSTVLTSSGHSQLNNRIRNTVNTMNELCPLTVPDPAKATTLGEMLFIASLASEESRERILHDMAEELYFTSQTFPKSKRQSEQLSQFATSLIGQFGNQAFDNSKMNVMMSNAPYPVFPIEVFGAQRLGSFAFVSGTTAIKSRAALFTDNTSSNQREIVAAVTARLRRNLVVEADRLLSVTHQHATLFAPIAEKVDRILDYLAYSLALEDRTAGTVQVNLSSKSFAAQSLAGQQSQPGCEFNFDVLVNRLGQIAGIVDLRDTLSSNAPRVSAADQMIKRYIEGFEKDLDHFFLEPLLKDINAVVTGKGITHGGYESKSLIATNRLLARVESLGSGTVTRPQDTDFLGEAATLLNLFNQARNGSQSKANTTAANALKEGAALAVTTAAGADFLKDTGLRDLTGFGTLGLAVGALLGLPDEPRGTIYSLGTGGIFKVTPIFDPSGQGIRFSFNYVQSTMIQGADETSDADIPKIDRFTTNTEVAITNLDLEVISSASSNYKLGAPERRTGGVPFLRDIPIIKEIPIVGYFVRSPKVDPLRQHTLIFAQTSMYPTVADIVNLMLDTPPGGEVAGKLGRLSSPKKDEQDKPGGN